MPGRVLLVDDDEDLLYTMRLILSNVPGLDVITEETVAGGIRRLLTGPAFSAVIADLRVGPDDGRDVLDEAERSMPEAARMLLTGLTEEDLREAGCFPGNAVVFEKNRVMGSTRQFVDAVLQLLRGPASGHVEIPQ